MATSAEAQGEMEGPDHEQRVDDGQAILKDLRIMLENRPGALAVTTPVSLESSRVGSNPGTMDKPMQVERAKQFQALHRAPVLLVLPNAWDAGSAVLFEKAGFSAVGTTSAGIAYSLGYPDGERLPLEELLAAQRNIARRISIPLSADIEAGYGLTPEQVVENVEQVIATGAVGINLEDGTPEGPPRLADRLAQCEVLEAISRFKETSGIPFVINARTDSFWLGLGDEDRQLEESITRGNAYLDAGADCVFVPGSMSREFTETLVQELHGPLNLIATPSTPPPHELESLGVARLSVGSGPVRASLGLIWQIAKELRQGSLAWLTDVDLGYDEANRLFDQPARNRADSTPGE